MGAGVGLALFLVELDTDLGRTLEDVEELPKRQIEKSGNDGHGMQDGEKVIEVSA